MDSQENPWLPRRGPRRDAKLRLLCFPHAGGGSAVYHRWTSDLPAAIDILPVLLPGRERRIQEQPADNLYDLAAMIADALGELLDTGYALFGHSMGAMIAFELARELRRRGLPAPRRLFVAAYQAPHLPRRSEPIHDLPDAEFVQEIQDRFAGVPPEIANNDELLRLFLPALRADVMMIETYHYREEPPLKCPITVLGGADDKQVSTADLAAWRLHTAAGFGQKVLMGGHFFVAERQAEVTQIIHTALAGDLS